MRKLLLTLTTLLFTVFLAEAQTIPNGNFESWTTDQTYEVPTVWLDADTIQFSNNAAINETFGSFVTIQYTPSVTRVAGYNSTYAAKLTNVVNNYIYNIAGFPSYNEPDTVPGYLQLNDTLTSAPATLSGYYQFTKTGAEVSVSFNCK